MDARIEICWLVLSLIRQIVNWYGCTTNTLLHYTITLANVDYGLLGGIVSWSLILVNILMHVIHFCSTQAADTKIIVCFVLRTLNIRLQITRLSWYKTVFWLIIVNIRLWHEKNKYYLYESSFLVQNLPYFFNILEKQLCCAKLSWWINRCYFQIIITL